MGGAVNIAFHPIGWYAKEILSGVPFSFPRFGDGDWRAILPELSYPTNKYWRSWNTLERQELRTATASIHNHPRYWAAFSRRHQQGLHRRGWLVHVKNFIRDENLSWVKWHDALIWRLATRTGAFYCIVEALREQSLPIVFIGPGYLSEVENRIPITGYLVTHPTEAIKSLDHLHIAILSFHRPAIFAFSCGSTANILIHRLFPEVGHQSYLIDFGAVWDGLLGNPCRSGQKHITPALVQRNWEGS